MAMNAVQSEAYRPRKGVGYGPQSGSVRSICLDNSTSPLHLSPSLLLFHPPPHSLSHDCTSARFIGPSKPSWFLTLPRPTTLSLGSPRLSSQCLFFLLSLTFPVRSRDLVFLLFRCDADPSALADYILALLKHNGPEPELRKELASQLDEFLEKGAPLVIPFSHFLNTPLCA